jgi:hypothetical protein
LSTYSNGLRSAGFVTCELHEPTAGEESIKLHPEMERYWGLPPFLVWLARRR